MIIWRGAFFVSFTFEMLEDKVEFFEAPNLVSLEKKIFLSLIRDLIRN